MPQEGSLRLQSEDKQKPNSVHQQSWQTLTSGLCLQIYTQGAYATRNARGGQRGGRGSGGRSNGYGDERGGRAGGEQGKGGGEEKDLKAKQFDLVFLDPPTWSKSKHGAVDLVRDYQVCLLSCPLGLLRALD